MRIADVLGGNAGLAGVQWVLTGAEGRDTLRQVLTTMLAPDAVLGTCRLHRAKYKPGRDLAAYYDVELHSASGTPLRTRSLEVVWRPPAADQSSLSAAEAAMEAEAHARGLAAPFHQLSATVPAWNMHLRVNPLDAEFPQLVRMSDPDYAGSVLAAAVGLSDHATGSATLEVTPIRYRPGQRHVLRYAMVDTTPAERPTVFAKIYNSDKGIRSFTTATRVAEWLAAESSDVAAARPSAYVADERTVVYPLVKGTPLAHELRTLHRGTGEHLRCAGAALGLLHRTPPGLVELQPHSVDKEVKAIASASKHIRPLLPEVGSAIDEILSRAQDAWMRLPPAAPALAYGDFKADHIWITSTGYTLIDFDTCYLADQAIDLGKFLADVHWWFDSYGHEGVEEAQQQFLAGYSASVSAELLARARVFEALVLVKSTARRVPLFAHDWVERTSRLVARAAALSQRFATAGASGV